QVAAIARELGVSRLRTALNGRRYEEFFELKKWNDFAAHWQETLQQVEPILKKHRPLVGIENHQEWLADELAEILRRFSSPPLGTIREHVRRGRSDVAFSLEMITRATLQVTYLNDESRTSYEKRDARQIDRINSKILTRGSAKPLSTISGMTRTKMLAIEEAN